MNNFKILIFFMFFTNFTLGNFSKENNNLSNDDHHFQFSQSRYLGKPLKLPLIVHYQLDLDQNENKKTFSENATQSLKFLNGKKEKTFFFINDNQIRNSKNEKVIWWDKNNRHFGTKINYTDEQFNKVKTALRHLKKDLINNDYWFQERNSNYSWNFYKNNICNFLKIKRISDGDTIIFENLKGKKLLESKTKIKLAKSDNLRLLVVDTDETSWSRWNTHKNDLNANEYLPTRLGYTQKVVIKILNDIYENENWCVIPLSFDRYNRTLSLVFTYDGIPLHKFIIEYYGGTIYSNHKQVKEFEKREKWLMLQWWMINYWKDRLNLIPDFKKESDFEISKKNDNEDNLEEKKEESYLGIFFFLNEVKIFFENILKVATFF